MPYLIGALIAIYAGYIIYKKIKDLNTGKFCSCGCTNCPSQTKCKDQKNIPITPTQDAQPDEDIPEMIINRRNKK